MRWLAAICLALAVAACGPSASDTPETQATETAAEATTASADPDTVELRIRVPKSVLPEGFTVPEAASAERDEAEYSPEQLAQLAAFFGVSDNTEAGYLPKGCHRVCVWDCHEVGGGTGKVCYRSCEVDCPGL